MKIRVGYEVAYQSPQPTPMVLTLRVHPSRAADLVSSDPIVTTPPIAIGEYHDSFGNICSRIVAPAVGRCALRPADHVSSARQCFCGRMRP